MYQNYSVIVHYRTYNIESSIDPARDQGAIRPSKRNRRDVTPFNPQRVFTIKGRADGGPIAWDFTLEAVLSFFGRFCRDQHLVLLKHFSQLPVLVHTHQYITATDELLLQVELGYRRPIGVFFQTCVTVVQHRCWRQHGRERSEAHLVATLRFPEH